MIPTIRNTKFLSPFQFEQIDALWNQEYPLSLKDRFKILLDGTEYYQHYLIENEDEQITAWALVFEKESELRFSIIVHQLYQGKGLGRLLLDHLKSRHHEFYGWVIDHERDLKANGEIYRNPLPFYRKEGFEVLSDVRLETEIISAVKIRWSYSSVRSKT